MESTAFSRCFSKELASVVWGFAGIFVLAIGINVDALAKPSVKPFSPGCQLFRGVIFKAQAGVGETGGEHLRRCLLLGLRQAERRFALTKDRIRFVGVPRGMTYLKSEMESGRAKSKKFFQQGAIELESRRQLYEDRTEVVT